ncbi:hypothetical protein [Allosphingosinicella sp.]|jgi:hypothetical protein|uniref:hypothetical protein n=1 Tax=Allosphingosinicella sp. TaxID=2823234 RepID=UPI002F0D4D54
MQIAICSPAYGDTKAQFTYCLAELLIHAGREGIRAEGGDKAQPQLRMLMASSSNVALNRQTLAEIAVGSRADYVLWLDTDQTFPPDTLQMLFRHTGRAKVVGCNYARRTDPTGPTALRIENGRPEFIWTDEAKARAGPLDPVDSMGLGVCLTSTEVFKAIPKPWFAPDINGEDGYFFLKLRAAGVPAFVDHQLSLRIGHIGERVYLNADALADRARWTPPPLQAG